jgi:hypothetical protein
MPSQIKITIPRKWLPNKTYNRVIAGAWDEFEDSTRLLCLHALATSTGELKAKVGILRAMLKLPKVVFESIDDERLSALVDTLDWMHLDPKMVRIESFWHRGVKYKLPKAKFEDGVGIEFPMADQFFQKFQKSSKEEDLLQLVATLARPVSRSGRSKIMGVEDVDRIAQKLNGLSTTNTIAVMLYYLNLKQYISELYGPYLFNADEDDGKVYESTVHFPNFGWWGTYIVIAESGVFGNYEAVLQTNFHRICMFLVEKRKESKQIKELNQPKKGTE